MSHQVYKRFSDGTTELIGYVEEIDLVSTNGGSPIFLDSSKPNAGVSFQIHLDGWRPMSAVTDSETLARDALLARVQAQADLEENKKAYEKVVAHLVWTLGGAIVIHRHELEAHEDLTLDAVENKEKDTITLTALKKED